MTLKERRKLFALLEEWTRCEIVSRLAHVEFQVYGDAARRKWEVEDAIRDLLYGQHDLTALGERFGILPKATRPERKVKVNPALQKYKKKDHS